MCPIYEYQCPECNIEEELIQKFDDPYPLCEVCQKEMKKKISLGSFRLKGSGWYITDYKKKG